MGEPRAVTLLRRAAAMYDGDESLRTAARKAWRGGFGSGAEWMRMAFEHVGHATAPTNLRDYHHLGVVKYMLATGAMMLVATAGVVWPVPWLILLSPLAFYAIEVQMLFLFPVALDGSPTPFRDALRLTRRAGGTLAVMPTVMTFAAVMLLGGFAGRGFVRCWCLGCLAVCLWYVDLTRGAAEPA